MGAAARPLVGGHCAGSSTAEDALKCAENARKGFLGSMETAFGSIGGLVAAIVIAELALTTPKEVPAARLFATPTDPPPSGTVKWATSIYLLVWAGTGLFAFLWASLHHPDALKPLTDYGNAWLGLAIASVYAYVGIERK